MFLLASQIGLCQHANRNSGYWTLAGSAQRLDFTDFSPKQAYGITAEVMVTKIWGIEFSVAGGKDYFESNAGPILGIIFILKTFALIDDDDDDDDDDGEITLAIIGAIIASFEHSNFHIPISNNLELIPNFNLLKYRYMWDENSGYNEHDFLSWSIGLKVGVFGKKNWFYNAFAERAQLYYTGRPNSWQIGLNFGYSFKNKKGKEKEKL